MIRALLWGLLWVCTLGILDIEVKYSDGLHIKYNSWLRPR